MAAQGKATPFEILEHTADIGVLARGRSLEELFENSAWGMVEIIGARVGKGGESRVQAIREISVLVHGDDREALLVAWLDEVLFLVDQGGGRVAGLVIREVAPDGAEGAVSLLAEADPPDGTELKAATYHQLAIRETEEGYEAIVYFDV